MVLCSTYLVPPGANPPSPPIVPTVELPEEEVRSKVTTSGPPEGDNNLVEVYADRLCAVSHAFALVCTTLQRSNKREGLLPRFLAFIDRYEKVLKVLLAR